MDPPENPSNPHAPGQPVPLSQGGFQFGTTPFCVFSTGQTTQASIVKPIVTQTNSAGLNVQIGSSILTADQKPTNEPAISNPFTTGRISSSIFGGRCTEQSSGDFSTVKQQTSFVTLESKDETNLSSSATVMAKPRLPSPTALVFTGHSIKQIGGTLQIHTKRRTSSESKQSKLTFSSEVNEKAVPAVSAEQYGDKSEQNFEFSNRLGSIAKEKVQNIVSENRLEDEEDLKVLQDMRDSLIKKLKSHKVDKKRKSTESKDGSPAKNTMEDKALYFTLPNRTFTKAMVKEHFSKFGDVSRVYLNVTKNHCIIHFSKHDDAVRAYEQGDVIDGCAVKLFWKNIIRTKKKSEGSKEVNADGKKSSTAKKRSLSLDPEVAEELAAMEGLDKYRPLPKESSEKSPPKLPISRSRNTNPPEESKRLSRRKEILKVTRKESVRNRIDVPIKEPEQLEKKAEADTADVFIEATAGARELITIMKSAATSLEDRLRILEARDKLIRLGQVKQCDLAKAKKTVGVCPDMCPEKERLLRETRRQVSFYETDDSSKGSRMNPNLAVKQYARSSADQEEPLPHELRPLPVLAMTMSYLLHCIADLCDRPGENLAEWYHFLWDRTRSIRKEITQQELCDVESVQLVEQCARFHIHCCARLVAEDVSVFDHRINTENLTKCLQTLKHMYYDLWVKQNLKCPNEPEFMSYFLLLNLTSGAVMWELEQLREDVLQTLEIDFVAKLYMAINSNNFVRFFRLVRSASYLTSCLAIRYFYQVRTLALRTHIKALNAKDKPILYPLATLVRELAFEDFNQGELFCSHHGLSVDHSQPGMPLVLFSRNTFRIATTVFAQSRAHQVVESKRACSVGQVIAGGALPSRNFDTHVPHDSFDEKGFLRPSAWHAVDQGMAPSDLSFEEELGLANELDSSADYGGDDHNQSASDPQPIIIEPEDEVEPTQQIKFPAEQISEIRNEQHRSLPDVIAPVARTEVIETKPLIQHPSSGFDAPKPFPFAQQPPQQTKTVFGAVSSSTSTWMTQSGTSQFKSLFGTSPKSSVNSIQTNQSRTISHEVTNSFQIPLFSKNVPSDKSFSSTGTTSNSMFSNTSAFSGAVNTFSNTSASVKSTPFGVSIVDDARKTIPEIPAPKPTQIVQKPRVDEKALAAKKEAEAREMEEKMRARLLESQIVKTSQEFFDEWISEELRHEVEESLKAAQKEEEETREKRVIELCNTLLTEVLLKELEYIVSEEFDEALRIERERHLRRITDKYFKRWLEKTRLSLSRKKAIENFPAGVTHLTLEEHAKRWGTPSLAHIEDFVKQNGFHVRGITKQRHSWTSLSSLVAKEVMLRYHDQCRQLRWKHSSEVSFKVLISVSSAINDRASRVTEWFVRNPQQLKHGSISENSELGLVRAVTTYQIDSEQIVHSSLQLVRGYKPFLVDPELLAGTRAILFTMNVSENTNCCCDRLEALVESLDGLPGPPLVVVVFGNQNALDLVTLQTLISNLDLHKKVRKGRISEYKVLYLKESADLQTVDCELKKVLSYVAQRWRPPQQFTVKPMRTVLIGAFDMFFISLKCSLDRSQPSKLINDPQVLTALCNEFLKQICVVLLKSRRESRFLCAPELWGSIHKGAYDCFHNNRSYEEHIANLLSSMRWPKVSGWPPKDPSEFKTWLDHSKSIVSQSADLIERWNKVTPWPLVLEDIPWIQVFRDCMEKKFQESHMSTLCNTELYVVIDSKSLEKLHNGPWWKHSKSLRAYLSKFEKQIENANQLLENVPPSKKRPIDDVLQDQSVPDVEEISQIMEDHQQSLRNLAEDDLEKTGESAPKKSKLEIMIDSLQSRLGIGPYSSLIVKPEAKKVETPQPVPPLPPQEVPQVEKESEAVVDVVQKPDSSEKEVESGKDKMRKILEAARNIVAPLKLSAPSKHRQKIQDLLLGRKQGDLSAAARMPLSALCRSEFVERSQREVEQRLKLCKRHASPELEENEPESNYGDSCDSRSDSTSRAGRRNRRSSSESSRSSFSDDSRSSVEAYSVASEEEKSYSENDNESMEYEEHDRSKDDDIDCAVTVEVIRSSSEGREEEEGNFEEEEDERNFEDDVDEGRYEEYEENMEGEENLNEGDEGNFHENEEEEDFGDVEEDEERKCSESDMRFTDVEDVDTDHTTSEDRDGFDEDEMEDKYDHDDSDIQEISSGKDDNVEQNDHVDVKGRTIYSGKYDSSSDEVVSDND